MAHLATKYGIDLISTRRMYREPSSTEASKHNALKDPSAAARSTIRRQNSVRRPSRYGTFRGASHRLGRHPFNDSITGNSLHDREGSGLSYHVRSPGRTIGDLFAREARELGYPLPAPSEDNPFHLTGASSSANRREAGQRLLADAARHGNPGRRLRLPHDTMLAELLNRPSPGDGSRNQHSSEALPFTPQFAPALAYHSTISSQPRSSARLSPFPRTDGPGDGLPPPRIPQLRRAVEQSISDFNRTNRGPNIDGLGDRQRSLSPDEDDDHAHNAWETLLTTITPDANLPSNESSFASTSASATNASRSGTTLDSSNSTQTLPSNLDSTATNVHMILDPYPDFLNPCDYPTSSDSESDPELDLEGEGNRQSRRRRDLSRTRFMDVLRQSHDLNSTMSSQPPIPTFSFSFSDATADPDLHQMQSILNRLARREDIPEDWWSAAGLSRTVGRRLGAGDETPDPDSGDTSAPQVTM